MTKKRQRVSLWKSFKLAGSAAFKTEDRTGADASLLATIIFGLWRWIRGAPVDGSSGSSAPDD